MFAALVCLNGIAPCFCCGVVLSKPRAVFAAASFYQVGKHGLVILVSLLNPTRIVVQRRVIKLCTPELEAECQDKKQLWWTLYQEKDARSNPVKHQKMLDARLAYQKCQMDYLTLLTTR